MSKKTFLKRKLVHIENPQSSRKIDSLTIDFKTYPRKILDYKDKSSQDLQITEDTIIEKGMRIRLVSDFTTCKVKQNAKQNCQKPQGEKVEPNDFV